jgi:phosphohistidine phosphatase SixA
VRALLWACFALWAGQASALSLEDYLDQPERYGQVLLMRHAMAPGTGDPGDFELGNCASQRNLDARGQAQAIATGERLSAAGFAPQVIATSPWCRCHQAARLLALGEPEVDMGLASFFQGHVQRADTLAAFDALLGRIGERSAILVTHFVVISAVAGRSPASGGLVAFNPRTQESWSID